MLDFFLYVLMFTQLFFKGYLFYENTCEQQTTCHDCIRNSAGCVWCAHSDPIKVRCKLKNTYSSSGFWCPEEPQNPASSLTIPDQYNRAFCADPGNVIQIKPQRYKFKTRVGESISFNFSFKGAKDYPVDLYFLFDASNTMTHVQQETAKQSEKIFKTMKTMTSDVYLGMGKFIDKNALPFVRTISNQTYSFKHQLKLTTKFKEFHNAVLNMSFGTNRDNPEGGLDALAQVIVCKDVIGWRTESRKIIILLTDAAYHAAGDGHAAGITRPYDGKCYTENGVYTKELVMDYPSVSMINKLAAEHDVIILFLIEDRRLYIYEDLSRVITGSKAYGYKEDAIEDESVVKVLRDIYQQITKAVKLKTNVKFGNRKKIKVTYDPDCSRPNIDKNCETKNEEEKHFTGKLQILEYDQINNYTVEIAIEGISEKLTLDIEVINDCECTKYAKKTEYCYGEIQECGVCKCSDGRYEETCACAKNGTFTCIAEKSNDTCSNHGSCKCGTCSCHDGFEGKYCECKKNACPLNGNGESCNGHGTCVCGKCHCVDGWKEEQCQCPPSNDGCMGPNYKICYNRGKCVCGKCECPEPPKWYKQYDRQDEFCNILPCPTCHSFQCRELDACALSLWGKGECEDDRIKPSWIEKLTDDHTNSTVWNICPDVRVDTGCYTRYAYKYNDDYGIDILVPENKDCTKNYLIYGITCLIVMLLIGIATIIGWKLLTDARDKNEYEKFVKLQSEDGLELCVNPTYQPSTTNFVNPAFRKPSVDVR